MDPYPAIAHETTPNGAPAAGFSGVTFKLLGPLEVLKDDRDCAPTAPKVLQLLGMLLLQAGTAVLQIANQNPQNVLALLRQ